MRSAATGRSWIVIPVKPFQETKTRLAPVLDAAHRAALTRRLLAQQLTTLAPFRARARLLVVSRGEDALAQAAAAGWHTLREQPPFSLNSAAAQAQQAAREAGAPDLLLLPVDLPWLHADDVAALLAQPADHLTIATDRHLQGTNALRLPTHIPFPFQFGPDSRFRHLTAAGRLGIPTTELRRPGLQFDLDTVDDWAIYQRWRLAADRTIAGPLPT